MMYVTRQAFVDAVGHDLLLQLTDLDGVGQLETAAIDKAITNASAEIDSYLSVRYETPLTTPSEVIKEHCVSIAFYKLHRVAPDPEGLVAIRKADALKWLRLAADGKVSVGVVEAKPTGNGRAVLVNTGAPRLFNRRSMRGY